MKTFKWTTDMYINGLKWKVVFLDMNDKTLGDKLGTAQYDAKTIRVGIHLVDSGNMLIDRTTKVLMHEMGHAYMHTMPIEETLDASSQSEYIANVWETAYLYSEYANEIIKEMHKAWLKYKKDTQKVVPIVSNTPKTTPDMVVNTQTNEVLDVEFLANVAQTNKHVINDDEFDRIVDKAVEEMLKKAEIVVKMPQTSVTEEDDKSEEKAEKDKLVIN